MRFTPNQRARIAQTLFRMSRALTAARDEARVVETALEQIRELLHTHAYIALKRPTGYDLRALPGDEADPVIDKLVLEWVLRHGDLASFGSKSHGQAAFLYVPIRAQDEVYGAFIVGEPGQFRLATRGEIVDILRAMANLVAIALSRIASEERARIADIAAESERIRTAILNSISHELRTPITTSLCSGRPRPCSIPAQRSIRRIGANSCGRFATAPCA
ncbi:GAF domain-containing protein [Alicyclobacillus sendaiensis]|uniref:GAF domain-containing protein n=1 Tax=Alicyclobacillus sendaiensis TaxID=192387 RepID=UPI0014702F35|nr:GAF domain-containing protein [Alicyclobacillus sendaiensis]